MSFRRYVSSFSKEKRKIQCQEKAKALDNCVAVVSRLEQHRPQIKPPPHLDQAERAVFERSWRIVRRRISCAKQWPLLIAYCRAYLLTQLAFDAACDDPAQLPQWERAARVMASLSTKLRLAPSTTDPKTLSAAAGIDP